MTSPPQPYDDHRPGKEFKVSREELAKALGNKQTFFLLEGGIVHSGTFHGQPCLVTDEGTLADFLEDGEDMASLDPRVRIFDDLGHRDAYVAESGWSEPRRRWREHRLRELRHEIGRAWADGGLEAAERDALLACVTAFEASPATPGPAGKAH